MMCLRAHGEWYSLEAGLLLPASLKVLSIQLEPSHISHPAQQAEWSLALTAT